MFRPLPIVAAMAVCASLALAVGIRVPVPAPDRVASTIPAGERIDAAHAVVDDYVKMTAEARLAADRAADAELAESRRLAAAEAARHVAVMSAKPARTARVTGVQPVPLPEPAPVSAPLQLQGPQPVSEPAPKPKRPVLGRVVHTVERIPHWVSSGVANAATWVIDLPSQAVARLPERRFL